MPDIYMRNLTGTKNCVEYCNSRNYTTDRNGVICIPDYQKQSIDTQRLFMLGYVKCDEGWLKARGYLPEEKETVEAAIERMKKEPVKIMKAIGEAAGEVAAEFVEDIAINKPELLAGVPKKKLYKKVGEEASGKPILEEVGPAIVHLGDSKINESDVLDIHIPEEQRAKSAISDFDKIVDKTIEVRNEQFWKDPEKTIENIKSIPDRLDPNHCSQIKSDGNQCGWRKLIGDKCYLHSTLEEKRLYRRTHPKKKKVKKK